jgi:hypothetical protein
MAQSGATSFSPAKIGKESFIINGLVTTRGLKVKAQWLIKEGDGQKP